VEGGGGGTFSYVLRQGKVWRLRGGGQRRRIILHGGKREAALGRSLGRDPHLHRPSPASHGRLGRLHPLLLPRLLLLVGDLHQDEAQAADDAHAHQDEDAAHVLQAQRGRRVVVVVAAVHLVVEQDPLVVQVLHDAAWGEGRGANFHLLFAIKLTLVEVQDGQGDLIRPGAVLLQSDAVAAPAEEVARGDQLAVPGGLELQARAVPDEGVEVAAREGGEEGEDELR